MFERHSWITNNLGIDTIKEWSKSILCNLANGKLRKNVKKRSYIDDRSDVVAAVAAVDVVAVPVVVPVAVVTGFAWPVPVDARSIFN